MMKRTLLALGAMTVLIASSAFAETINFKADLTGASEVPPVNTAGKGSPTAAYDTVSKRLSWKGTVSGLTGDANAAHRVLAKLYCCECTRDRHPPDTPRPRRRGDRMSVVS